MTWIGVNQFQGDIGSKRHRVVSLIPFLEVASNDSEDFGRSLVEPDRGPGVV